MDIATYEKSRDELTGLLAEAIALPQLPEAEEQQLKEVRRRINEDEFSIVLIGEYQSGKSMTFDALCDGRELNKIGDGNKTSGCIVTARNIANPDEPEKITVTWRTKGEILDGFTRLLEAEIRERAPERFEGDNKNLNDVVDLDNPHDRQLIAEAAPIVWNERFEQDEDSDGVDKDILCIALLAARFWGSPELEAYMAKTEYSLSDLKKLCHYPSNWNEWGTNIAGKESRFTVDDLLTVFIKTIDIHLHATNLKRIGCVFMDAPGLFASDWDTNIANQAMQTANAIIYVFSDRKTIKASDCKVLDGLAPHAHGLGEKLFFAFNTQTKLVDSARILDSSLIHLKDRRMDFTPERTAIYHAPLALRSIQARHFIQNNLNADDMKIDGDKTPEQFLLNEMQDWHTALQGSGGSGTIDFTLEQTEKSLVISGFPDLIEKAANFVLSNRWRSVLIDRGAERIKESLKRVEGTLLNREKAAAMEVEQFHQEAAEKKKKFEEFSEKCKGIFKPLESDSFEITIADDFRNYYMAEEARLGLAKEVAQKLSNDIGPWDAVKKIWDSLIGTIKKDHEKQLSEKVSIIIRKLVSKYLREKIDTFKHELTEGKNANFNKLLSEIKNSCDSAKVLWDNTTMDIEEKDIRGMQPKWLTGNYQNDISLVAYDTLVTEVGKDAVGRAINYGGIGASLSTAVGILMPAGIVAWWAIAPILLAGAIWVYMQKDVDKAPDYYSFADEALKNIFYSLDLNDEKKKSPSKIYMESISEYRGKVLNYLYRRAEEPLKNHAERALNAEEDFRKSHEERAKLAQEARETRKNYFEPLRNRVEDFIARCLQVADK